MAVRRSSNPNPADDVEVVELSPEEGRALFEQRAQDWLGMSGDEFIHAWESGEIDDPDRTDVVMLALMIPFAR